MLLDHRVHRDPLAIGQRRNRRIFQRRQKTENGGQVRLAHVEHQTDPSLRGDRSAEHDRQVLDLLPPRRIGPGGPVRHQLRVGLKYRFEDSQMVCAQ